MDDLEKMNTKKKKFTEYQQDYNLYSKSIVHILCTNISLFLCMLLPFLLIGFIWTDFGTPKIDFKLISDGIVTVALFVIGETMMMRVGASGGKLDTEYVKTKGELDSLLTSVYDIGTMLLPVFCEWQIDCEMKQAVATRLRYLRFTKEDWEKVKNTPYKMLVRKYGVKKAKRSVELNKLEPVELNEAILLFNNGNAFARGGVPESGEEYIDKKTHSPQMIMSAIFAGLLTVSVAITLTSDISFSRVMYTAFKVVILLYRMAEGYSIGAKAYNTVEVKQFCARSNYLRQYIKFINGKLYLKIGDKYGDISCFIPDEPIAEGPKEEPLTENTPTDTPTVEVTPTCTNLHELTPTNE